MSSSDLPPHDVFEDLADQFIGSGSIPATDTSPNVTGTYVRSGSINLTPKLRPANISHRSSMSISHDDNSSDEDYDKADLDNMINSACNDFSEQERTADDLEQFILSATEQVNIDIETGELSVGRLKPLVEQSGNGGYGKLRISPETVNKQKVKDRFSVDVLLVTNMPILAGAWIGCCVQRIADKHSATSLISIESDNNVRLDWYPQNCIQRDNSDKHQVNHKSLKDLRYPELVPPPLSLSDARNRLNKYNPLWLLQVPSIGDLSQVETKLNIDRIVILTGADQAAVVATYRILKRITQLSLKSMPTISLILVGSDKQRAQYAFNKIARTASTFLLHELELLDVVPQIEPTGGKTHGRFAGRLPVTSWMVEDLLNGPVAQDDSYEPSARNIAHKHHHQRIIKSQPTDIPVKQQINNNIAACETHTDNYLIDYKNKITGKPCSKVVNYFDDDEVADRNDVGKRQDTANVDNNRDKSNQVQPKLQHKQQDTDTIIKKEEDSHKYHSSESHAISTYPVGCRDNTISLVSFLADHKALQARCPYAIDVELSVDHKGQIHACVYDEDGYDPIAALMTVSGWVMEHISLLSDMPGGSSINHTDLNTDHKVICHLFTDQPRQRRSLINSRIKLHLLCTTGDGKSNNNGSGSAKKYMHFELN